VATDGRLASKVAVVSGGGQGIGRGVALAFAAEAAHVAILDLTEEKSSLVARECAARGTDALGLRCDVAERAEVDRAVSAVVDRFGGIDVLVTAALPKIAVEPFELTTAERMEKLWRVGFLGVTNLMQACLPYLKAGGGRVINFGSGAGIGGARGYAAYAPVKEAVRTITRIAAREWGQFGINVNAICPFAKSDQFDEWAEANPDQVRAALAGTVLGRAGDPERDIGRAAVFLASDDAAFITGQSLMVDGGQTMPI
jgi:2-hydroxycyclohexanecarboxyl-CoA dehydrogenase